MKKMKFFLTFFICLALSQLYGQNIQIRGIVTDAADNSTLPGAAVAVKGTNTVVSTLNDGSFTISAPANGVLVFSFIGMTTLEVSVDSRSVINVALVTSTSVLEEVVVTAMNITRDKKSIGYATQAVNSEQLTQAGQTDLNNALAGKVSGVRFWGASGATFDVGSIVLRGTTSLTASGSSPIYVLDGVITPVNAIDMDNVESVNVLKGPAATALYGSRGGNGAVIVTSKRGAMSKGTFEFSQNIVFEQVNTTARMQTEYGGGSLGAEGNLMTFQFNPSVHPSYLQALNGKRYFDMNNDMSWGPKFDGQPYAPWYAWDPTDVRFGQTAPWVGQPADNIKDLYRTGISYTTNLAFSKSGDGFRMRATFSNNSRSGVVENSDAVRRFVTLSASYDINPRFRISADYRYTYRKNHNPAVEGYSNMGNFQYSYMQWFHRDVNFADLKHDYVRSDGTFRSWNPTSLTNLAPAFHDNPYALMNEINRYSSTHYNLMTGTIQYDLIPKMLTIGGTVNSNIRYSFNETKIPYNINGSTPAYSFEKDNITDTQLQGWLSYGQRFVNDKLDVSLKAFVEQRDYDRFYNYASTADGLVANNYFNLAASVGRPSATNSLTQTKYRSVFGTGVIGWNSTYYLDFSIRNDWSSTLPKANNSYLYGGVSASMIVSNLMKGVTWLDFWKIRASLAQVGSDLNAYSILETYSFGTRYGNNSAMTMTTTMRNPNIKPTISTSYEAGTEFRLFKNRLYGDFNFYTKDSKNQIISINVAPTSGYSTVQMNVGMIRNRGFEVSFGGSPIKNKNFEWSLYVNWSKNKNTLVELNDDIEQYRLGYYAFSTYIYSFAEVGKPIGLIRASAWDRSPDGQMIFNKNASTGALTPVRLTSAQKEFGSVQPDATGGFGTSFNWKGFRLSMSFDYQIGGQIASVTNMFGEQSGLLSSTAVLNDRGDNIRSNWREKGGFYVEGVTRTGTGDAAVYTPVSGYMDAENWFYYKGTIWEPYIYDTSYLKMRELSLSYVIPQKVLRQAKLGLSQARFSIIAQNPWLIYSGIPNVDASSIGNAWGNGVVEQGQVFSTRTLGFSLNLTF